jgi:hypothetical protein
MRPRLATQPKEIKNEISGWRGSYDNFITYLFHFDSVIFPFLLLVRAYQVRWKGNRSGLGVPFGKREKNAFFSNSSLSSVFKLPLFTLLDCLRFTFERCEEEEKGKIMSTSEILARAFKLKFYLQILIFFFVFAFSLPLL